MSPIKQTFGTQLYSTSLGNALCVSGVCEDVCYYLTARLISLRLWKIFKRKYTPEVFLGKDDSL